MKKRMDIIFGEGIEAYKIADQDIINEFNEAFEKRENWIKCNITADGEAVEAWINLDQVKLVTFKD